MTFVEACRAFRRNGRPAVQRQHSVRRRGGDRLALASRLHGGELNELKADIMLVCDTGMWDRETPAITTMLRGLVLEEVILRGANRLHSGQYGGAAINPIRVLSRIVADLHDANGAVTLPGFYDGVEELPEEIAHPMARSQLRRRRISRRSWPLRSRRRARAQRARDDLVAPDLRRQRHRRRLYRGRHENGPAGDRQRQIFPSGWSVKQNPEKIAQNFRAFVNARLPADVRAEFVAHGASPAIVLPTKTEALRRARRALEAEWGKPPVLIGSGGSIPIVGVFKRELNMDALMIGFGLNDDSIHSPNEKYERSSFHKGARSWARLLAALAA